MKRARDNRQLLLPLDLPAKAWPTGEIIYYDLVRKWHKVKPHLNEPILKAILLRDFNRYTQGLYGEPFRRGEYPSDFDHDDWRWELRRRKASYWDYTCRGACHWLVNFTLRLAMLVEPKRRWRIITSDKHSTVWDGRNTVFDFNFQAMGVPAEECFKMAYKKELRPGRFMTAGFPAHHTERVIITRDQAGGFLVTRVDNAHGFERELQVRKCDTHRKAMAIAQRWVGSSGRIVDRTQQPFAAQPSMPITPVGFEYGLSVNNRSAGADMSRCVSTPAALRIPYALSSYISQLGALAGACTVHREVGQRRYRPRRKLSASVMRDLFAQVLDTQSESTAACDVTLPRGSLTTLVTTRELSRPAQDGTIEYEDLDNASAAYLEATRRPDGRIIYNDTESRPVVQIEVKAMRRVGPNRWVAKLHKTIIKFPAKPLPPANSDAKQSKQTVQHGKLGLPAKENAGGDLTTLDRAPLSAKRAPSPQAPVPLHETRRPRQAVLRRKDHMPGLQRALAKRFTLKATSRVLHRKSREERTIGRLSHCGFTPPFCSSWLASSCSSLRAVSSSPFS